MLMTKVKPAVRVPLFQGRGGSWGHLLRVQDLHVPGGYRNKVKSALLGPIVII